MSKQQLRFFIPIALFFSIFVISCSRDGLNANGNRADAASDVAPDLSSVQPCNYQGAMYTLGQSFKEDCNTCTCTSSGISCTLLLCISWTGGASGNMGGASGNMGGPGGSGGSGGSGGKIGSGGAGGTISKPDAAPQVCLVDELTYAVGETFKRDCNTCTCLADGVSCTKMVCPSPTDAAADLPRSADAGQTCSYGGRNYLIGESFKIDCNTCNCTSIGLACTGMACLHDGGSDIPFSVDATATCALSANLTFGYDGGSALYWDANRLTATTFTVTRSYSMRAGLDGSTTATCSPSLPACGSIGTVTTATINADLADPDVQTAWGLPQSSAPLYGTDPRPVDGAVYSIALDDGRKVLVGGPCASPLMSSCRYIPTGLVQLTQDLQKLASSMAADPVCKAAL